jgi:beta-mannanase
VLSRVPAGEAAPRDQTLFGMDVPSLRQLDASEHAVGAHAAIVGTFADWAHSPDFPQGLAARINARGAVPMLSWEPWDSWAGRPEQPVYAPARIAAGGHDGLIDRWAAQIAAYRRPLLLRFAPEMNGERLPWTAGPPEEYVAAWRHVRARFRRAGADNALFVWNPVAHGPRPLAPLFPGEEEVDWVAVDGRGPAPFATALAPAILELWQLAPDRPLMIAETGTPPGPGKAAWIADTLAHTEGVDALVWFEFDTDADWRLAECLEAARGALDTPAFVQGGELAAVEQALAAIP